MKTEIEIVADGVWNLRKVNEKTGKVEDAHVEKSVQQLTPAQVGQIVGSTIKAASSRRDGWLSFLGMVYAHARLDGFKGKGDRTTGKISTEFKAAVRSVEESVVTALVEQGHIKLPKQGNPEENLQAFLSGLRDDKNYSNAKVTTNKYFALVGSNCVTKSGYLVPVPVMQAQIAEVVDRPEPDTTVRGKLKAIEEFMGKGTIASDDAIDSLSIAKSLVLTLQGIVTQYAELATEKRGNKELTKDVASAAQAAIEGAREKSPATQEAASV